MRRQTFPLFNGDLFMRPIGGFCDALICQLFRILEATHYQPYSQMLNPMRVWAESPTMYTFMKRQVAPIEDLFTFASAMLLVDRETLLSPARMETYISQLSWFGVFRSKEVWLDAFAEMLRDPVFYSLQEAEQRRIRAELLTTGSPGPGPRRLCRFIAGRIAHKGNYTAEELRTLGDLDNGILQHFQERFQQEGVIQGYFLCCEASKIIEDLFTARCPAYRPHQQLPDHRGYVVSALCFHVELNSMAMLRRYCMENLRRLFKRNSLCVIMVRHTLPRQVAIGWQR